MSVDWWLPLWTCCKLNWSDGTGELMTRFGLDATLEKSIGLEYIYFHTVIAACNSFAKPSSQYHYWHISMVVRLRWLYHHKLSVAWHISRNLWGFVSIPTVQSMVCAKWCVCYGQGLIINIEFEFEFTHRLMIVRIQLFEFYRIIIADS